MRSTYSTRMVPVGLRGFKTGRRSQAVYLLWTVHPERWTPSTLYERTLRTNSRCSDVCSTVVRRSNQFVDIANLGRARAKPLVQRGQAGAELDLTSGEARYTAKEPTSTPRQWLLDTDLLAVRILTFSGRASSDFGGGGGPGAGAMAGRTPTTLFQSRKLHA